MYDQEKINKELQEVKDKKLVSKIKENLMASGIKRTAPIIVSSTSNFVYRQDMLAADLWALLLVSN